MILRTLKFILFSSLPLVVILGWQHQLTVEREKHEQLSSNFQELEQEYTETVFELDESYQKNEQLFQMLHEALLKIEDVEMRNSELELILFNQRQTYRTAVAMQGSAMPVLTQSDFTARMYERAWIRLGAHGLKGTGEGFVGAEDKYGVNGLALAAIAYLESGGGMSKIARQKNNLFGLNAYGVNPYAVAFSFSSKEESIFYAANLLRTSYLSRGGRHYRGDCLESVGIRYAEDPNWADKVGRTMSLIARAAIPEGR